MCIPNKKKIKSDTSLCPNKVDKSKLVSVTAVSYLGETQKTVTEEDATQKEDTMVKKQEKRLNEVYKSMGAEPNDALARKLVQDKKNTKKTLEKMEKYGDIGFISGEVSSLPAPADDTIYEGPNKMNQRRMVVQKYKLDGNKPSKKTKGYSYSKSPAKAEKQQTGDVDFDPPNESNFMANLSDMAFTAHEMIRSAKRRDMPAIQNDIHPVSPWAQPNIIEKDSRFQWHSLRANTFFSNALSLPTHAERDHTMTANEEEHVVWVIPPLEMSQFKENDEEMTARSLTNFQINKTLEDN